MKLDDLYTYMYGCMTRVSAHIPESGSKVLKLFQILTECVPIHLGVLFNHIHGPNPFKGDE